MNVASVARRGEVQGAIGAAGLLEAQGHAREAPRAQKRHQVTLHGLEIPWIIMDAPCFFRVDGLPRHVQNRSKVIELRNGIKIAVSD